MGHKRIVDLSIAIEPDLPSDPPMMIPQIDYANHERGAEQMKDFYPGVKKEQLPGSLGWAVETITLTTHSGTHLDAPYHYHPTMDKGERALTIDEIPLEWCFNNGVLLDFRHKEDGERISAEDVQNELNRIEYEIKPFDIVLVQTGAIPGEGCRNDSRKYPVSDRKRCESCRHRRLELGSAPAVSGSGIQGKWGSKGHLGSPFCRH
jgi:kynurenine formamidase